MLSVWLKASRWLNKANPINRLQRGPRLTTKRLLALIGVFNTVVGFIANCVKYGRLLLDNRITLLDFLVHGLYIVALIFIHIFLAVFASESLFILVCLVFKFPESDRGIRASIYGTGIVVLVATGVAIFRPVIHLSESETLIATLGIILFLLLTALNIQAEQT